MINIAVGVGESLLALDGECRRLWPMSHLTPHTKVMPVCIRLFFHSGVLGDQIIEHAGSITTLYSTITSTILVGGARSLWVSGVTQFAHASRALDRP